MPSSGPWPQYSEDPSGWQSNQPDAYSAYSGTGEWHGSSAAMPWVQPEQSNNATATSQPFGTFPTPNQFPANPATASGYPQQSSLSSQVAPRMPKSGDGTLPLQQPNPASGSAYGWNNDVSAGQWQSQPQWSWPQNDNQWPSSQPFQFMVCCLCVCLLSIKDWLICVRVYCH